MTNMVSYSRMMREEQEEENEEDGETNVKE